jgi:P27 family predicted phage terminase small subunit
LVKGGKTPTSLKQLRGNPGRRPIGDEAGVPSGSEKVPRPPDYLTGEARREWFRVAPLLHEAGLLSKLDTTALAGYCINYARWREADEEIRRHGLVIRHPKGWPMVSPFVRIAREAYQAWTKALIEFGMTPKAALRIDRVNFDPGPGALTMVQLLQQILLPDSEFPHRRGIDAEMIARFPCTENGEAKQSAWPWGIPIDFSSQPRKRRRQAGSGKPAAVETSATDAPGRAESAEATDRAAVESSGNSANPVDEGLADIARAVFGNDSNGQ